jgi:DNA helicase INO80
MIFFDTNTFPTQVPKVVHNEIVQSSEVLCSAIGRGVGRESFQKHFNIFSPENVYRSVYAQDNISDRLLIKSGTFGFTHLMDLSPAEVAFLATSSFMERLLFSIMRQGQQFLDGTIDLLMEDMEDDNGNHLEKCKVRAVTRMLLMPSRSETDILQRKIATGLADNPFKALVNSHQDRLLSSIKLLHSTYTSIPRTRAPPVYLDSQIVYFLIIKELLTFEDFINILTFSHLHRLMANAQTETLPTK